MGDRTTGKPAAVQEYDEDARKTVRGTRVTASIKKQEGGTERPKERRTTSDVTMETRARPPPADASPPLLRTHSTRESSSRDERHDRHDRDERDDRRRSKGESSGSPRKSSRPPSSRHPSSLDSDKATRVVDPGYFGMSTAGESYVTHTASTAARPAYMRSRPASYIDPSSGGSSRPPPAPSAYFAQAHPVQAFIPNQSSSYFPEPDPDRERLHGRFGGRPEHYGGVPEPILRTSSAAGTTRTSADTAKEYIQRESRSIRSREDDGYGRMLPPPPRSSSRNNVRKSIVYHDDAYDDRHDRHYEPRSSRTPYQEAPAAPRRRSSSRGPTILEYDRSGQKILVETQDRRRSYYHDSIPRSSRSGASYEEKYAGAEQYQTHVGGPELKLTAEALRRAGKTNSSSTRSTASRDGSDFKRSVTTRTTRSGSSPEGDDVTIKVKGTATIEIGGVTMKCEDGAEVNLVNTKPIRGGSERSGSEYGGRTLLDDRRSRDGMRQAIAPRSSSRVGASRRSSQQWL